MAIRKAPTTDTTVSITIPGAMAPYFQSWYQDNKLDGETPSAFLIRQLKPTVIQHASMSYAMPVRELAQSNINAAEAEAKVLLNELG